MVPSRSIKDKGTLSVFESILKTGTYFCLPPLDILQKFWVIISRLLRPMCLVDKEKSHSLTRLHRFMDFIDLWTLTALKEDKYEGTLQTASMFVLVSAKQPARELGHSPLRGF